MDVVGRTMAQEIQRLGGGWVSAGGGIACDPESPLAALSKPGGSMEILAADAMKAEEEAMAARKECREAEEGGGAPDWTVWEGAREDAEHAFADACAQAYSEGWTRVACAQDLGRPILEAEGTAASLAAARESLESLALELGADVQEHAWRPRQGAGFRKARRFGAGIAARSDRAADAVWTASRRLAARMAAAGEAPALPKTALVLKADPGSMRIAPRHPRLVLDHVLIQYGGEFSAAQAALDGAAFEPRVISRGFTKSADVLVMDIDGAKDPSGLLAPLRRNAELNLGADGTLRPAVLTVALAAGARRDSAVKAALEPDGTDRAPAKIRLKAEILFLEEPDAAAKAWLAGIGARVPRTVDAYRKEAEAKAAGAAARAPRSTSWFPQLPGHGKDFRLTGLPKPPPKAAVKAPAPRSAAVRPRGGSDLAKQR